jgi:hypothetical protein
MVEGGGNDAKSTASEVRATLVAGALRQAVRDHLRWRGLSEELVAVRSLDRHKGPSQAPGMANIRLSKEERRAVLIWWEPRSDMPHLPEGVWPIDTYSYREMSQDPAIVEARGHKGVTVGRRWNAFIDPAGRLQRSGFDVRRFQVGDEWYTEMTERVSIVDPRGLTTDGGARVFSALRAGMDLLNLNAGNRLPLGDGRTDRLLFRVERVPAATNEHLPVTLVPRSEAMTQGRWHPDAPPEAYAHEGLHTAGLEEGGAPGTVLGAPAPDRDGNLIGDGSDMAIGLLQSSHLARLAQMIGPVHSGGYQGSDAVGSPWPVDPSGIRTVADLLVVVARIAGLDTIVPGDDPLIDPATAIVLLGEAFAALYPNRMVVFPAAARVVDDSVLDGRQTSVFFGGAERVQFDSWADLDARLIEAARTTGRSTALILLENGDAVGRAIVAHHLPDGTIAYLDLHQPPEQRVITDPLPDITAARASAVIVDAVGAEVPQLSQSSRTVDALIDPPRDRPDGPRGAEANTVPESVTNLTGLIRRAGRSSVDPSRLLVEVARSRFPGGLRSLPAAESETMETDAWVDSRLDNPNRSGVHRPHTWGELGALINRAGDEGMVLTLSSAGRQEAVYMRSDGRIWRIRVGQSGPVTELWRVPSNLSNDQPPRMALAFTHCADPVPTDNY